MTIAERMPHPIPVVRVSGSHRRVGEQVGEATADAIRRAATFEPNDLPGGRSVDDQLALAARYREVTERHLPWIVEELDGAAAAAGVDPLALFAHSVEEIWYWPPRPAVRGSAARGSAGSNRGRCSDLIAVAPSTANGHVLAAHNNDLSAETEQDIVAIEWRVPGEPMLLSLGIGPWISVGWNEEGLWLGGNELSPNDERVGLPRLLQVRDVLTKRTPKEAAEAALHPERASSYNWVFAHPSEGAMNVEGSATAAETTAPDARGVLAHTNHYVHPSMLGFEGDPDYAPHSEARYASACRMLDAAGAEPGSITTAGLRAMLSDHEGAPDSVCRHGDGGSASSKTVFWCVTDVTEGAISFGRGNPCNSQAQMYAFGPSGD